MKLNLLSPERRLVTDAAIESITLPTSEGQIQVLPGHAPMVGTLETGAFIYRTTEGTETIGVISSGFLEVVNDVVTVMAETTELKSEIDLARAKKAQASAEGKLDGSAELDEHEFKKYQLKLQRALIRQQVASQTH